MECTVSSSSSSEREREREGENLQADLVLACRFSTWKNGLNQQNDKEMVFAYPRFERFANESKAKLRESFRTLQTDPKEINPTQICTGWRECWYKWIWRRPTRKWRVLARTMMTTRESTIHDSYFEIRKQLQKIWLNLFLAGMLSCSQDDGNQPWTEVRGENLIKEIYTRRNKKQLKHTANEFSIETLITNHVQRQGVTRVLDTPKTLGEKRALSFDDFALATSYPVSFISKPFLSRSTISAYKKFGGSFFWNCHI